METTEIDRPVIDGADTQTPISSEVPNASPDMILRSKPLYVQAVLVSILAGLAAWGIGERTLTVFEPPPNMILAMGIWLNRPSFEDRTAADLKNVSIASGVLGACLGLALGGLSGVARRSWKRGVLAGLGGTVMGFLAGAMASALVLPAYYRQLDLSPEDLSHDLLLPFLIHGGTWLAVGAAGGITFAFGLNQKRKFLPIIIGAMVGSLLGTVVYEVVGAVGFSAARTTEPLAAAWAPRLVSKLSVCVLTALGAVYAATTESTAKRGRVVAD